MNAKEEYETKKKIYWELLNAFKKCGNLHLEDKWIEIEERYAIMRTERYMKAIESVMCDELQKSYDAVHAKGETDGK